MVSHIPLLVKIQHSEVKFTLGKNVLGFSSLMKQSININEEHCIVFSENSK